MESNWHWNVPEMGFSFSGYQRIARILSGPFAGFHLLQANAPDSRFWVVYIHVFVDGQLVYEFLAGDYTEPFPGDFVVEPD